MKLSNTNILFKAVVIVCLILISSYNSLSIKSNKSVIFENSSIYYPGEKSPKARSDKNAPKVTDWSYKTSYSTSSPKDKKVGKNYSLTAIIYNYIIYYQKHCKR